MKRYLKYLPYAVFFIAFISTIGSLYFSEVLHFTPCVLCWHQRIFMYPIAFISAVGIIRKHNEVYHYILPLSIIGFCIALYQNLLIWHILPEKIAPCVTGTSCVEQPFVLFSFITIPLGSLIAFALIIVSMLLYGKYFDREHN